jgi:hypothetical protein
MKIILILLALTSLFFTVLGGSFGVGCHGDEESCNKDKRHPAILVCKQGLWDYKEMCGENHICDKGPPVTCKEIHNARSFDDAASANGGDSSNDAVACHDYEEKCNTDTRRPAILQCKSGLWDTKQWCGAGERCHSGPPAICKKRLDARSFDDAVHANVASSPTVSAPAETCTGTEIRCSREKGRNAILRCTSDTVYYQTCSPTDYCVNGPPVACTKRFFVSTFWSQYTHSATSATSPTDPCASTDAAATSLPGHHLYTASHIHTASHTRPASPTDTESSSDSDCSSSSDSSDSSDDEAA